MPAVQIEEQLIERAQQRWRRSPRELGLPAEAGQRRVRQCQERDRARGPRAQQRSHRARQPRAPRPVDPGHIAPRTRCCTPHPATCWRCASDERAHGRIRRRDMTSEHHRISVDVETSYLDDQSEPREQRYVFAYTITIRNEGEVPARLLTRHWIITDANGRVQEVRGDGVVGEQPYLKPGPGLSLFQRRGARDAGRHHAGQLPDARRRRRAVRRPHSGVSPGDARHAAVSARRAI